MTNIKPGTEIPKQQSKPAPIDMREMVANTPTNELIQSERVSNKFQQLFALTHPGVSALQAAAFYEAEKFHFLKLMNESENLRKCTKLSQYGIFMDVAVNGLSFDPTFKHLYVVPYNHNVGTKDNKVWESRAALQISGIGELLLRTKQGQIKYADNPVLVYEGDEFQYGTANNTPFVNHVANIPAKSEKIIACYVRLTRSDNSVDIKVILPADMARFRKFSKDPNSKAWVDGEGGMWIAKCIKHAFKTYPKVRTGKFSELASNYVDTEFEDIPNSGAVMTVPENLDYTSDDMSNGMTQVDDIPAPVTKPAETFTVEKTVDKDLDF